MWQLWDETRAKVILHLDMNSFFASVEQAHDPTLKRDSNGCCRKPKRAKRHSCYLFI